MKGKLINFAGIDSCGKTTQVALLVEKLRGMGLPVETIDFPRYDTTVFGDLIARYLRGEFGGKDTVSPYLSSVLFAVDRFEMRDKIWDWLDEGKIVITNRYVEDNVAFQSTRLGSKTFSQSRDFINWLRNVEYNVFGSVEADLNILLLTSADVAHALLINRASKKYLSGDDMDIYEKDLQFQVDVQARYVDIAYDVAYSKPRQNYDSNEPSGKWRTVVCTAGDGGLRTPAAISDEVYLHLRSLSLCDYLNFAVVAKEVVI